jgi:hypothetical protein
MIACCTLQHNSTGRARQGKAGQDRDRQGRAGQARQAKAIDKRQGKAQAKAEQASD